MKYVSVNGERMEIEDFFQFITDTKDTYVYFLGDYNNISAVLRYLKLDKKYSKWLANNGK